MQRLLLVYGTGEGHTAKIMRRVAQMLDARGVEPILHDVQALGLPATTPEQLPRLCAGVVVGASVHFSRHEDAVSDFVRTYLDALQEVPTAFFSVSLAAAGRLPGHRRRTDAYIDEFLARTGWHPQQILPVAGALTYPQYPFAKQFIARMIAQSICGDIDITQNFEYTDWHAVADSARCFQAALTARSRWFPALSMAPELPSMDRGALAITSDHRSDL